MIVKPVVWLCIVGIWNLTVFGCYGLDKLKAVKHYWRIQESVLITLGFLLGGVGAVCGMVVFHHKISKWLFRALVPLALLATLAEMYLLCKFGIFIL